MPDLLPTVITAIAALAAVLGVIMLAGRGARLMRLAQPETSRRMALKQSLALDRTRRLLLVSCDGRDLLLLTGGNAEQVVAWLPPAAAPGEAGA